MALTAALLYLGLYWATSTVCFAFDICLASRETPPRHRLQPAPATARPLIWTWTAIASVRVVLAHPSYGLVGAVLHDARHRYTRSTTGRCPLRHPGGHAHSFSQQWLERAAVTVRTGVHPSWARTPNPPRDLIPGDIGGLYRVHIGVVLEAPAERTTIEVVARVGPYVSNLVKIDLLP